ncbi:MAG: hypothetical protein CFE21_09395 [Bacteroidetes bacterium B1(2017)]|nr:MAG: hypothetical protein CFE21_09395 [Bacteroidetes bacterium B1(2017)]
MKHLLFAIILLGNSVLYAQDLKFMEQDLLKEITAIRYWQEYTGNDSKINQDDSLAQANTRLKTKLITYTAKNSQTIQYAFKALQDQGMTIATSADKLFRIYSWDTWQGGTMHWFDNVYQFMDNKQSKSLSLTDKREEGDPGVWFSEIFTLQMDSNKTAYLGYCHAIYSTKDSYQGIKLFSIENGQLNDTLHLIKTKTGIRNELGFYFDFFSVVDRSERPVKLIYYYQNSKVLKIPLVLESGEVTSKFIEYIFTGHYFERRRK